MDLNLYMLVCDGMFKWLGGWNMEQCLFDEAFLVRV